MLIPITDGHGTLSEERTSGNSNADTVSVFLRRVVHARNVGVREGGGGPFPISFELSFDAPVEGSPSTIDAVALRVSAHNINIDLFGLKLPPCPSRDCSVSPKP